MPMAYLPSSGSPSLSHSCCQAVAFADPNCVIRLTAAYWSFAYVCAASSSTFGVTA